jgi:hypothetical protein
MLKVPFGLSSYFKPVKFRALSGCAILPRMEKDWIEQIKLRGMSNMLNLAFDVLEPVGPLAAQVLYVLQPALGFPVLRSAVEEIANALDEPGGLDVLRDRLNNG